MLNKKIPVKMTPVLCLIFSYAISMTQAVDVCSGPLIVLTLHVIKEKGFKKDVVLYGASSFFGSFLVSNETISSGLLVASPSTACSVLQSKSSSGVIMLVERGACAFTEKAVRVQASGAKAMLLYDNEPGAMAMLLYDNEPGCVNMAAENLAEAESISIVSVSLSQRTGKQLLQYIEQSEGSPVMVTLSPYQAPPGVDGSAVLLWLLAVGTLLAGSLWSGHDYAVCRKQQQQGREGHHQQASASHDPHPSEVVDITPAAAFAFVIAASAMLLAIFFFFNKAFFYILLTLFCFASTQAMTSVLASIACHCVPALTRHEIQVPLVGKCLSSVLLALPLAAGLSLVWAIMRHAAWAWILQDILGISLMLLIFRTLQISSLKVACILLPLAFLYDVFWVFIQPRIFGGGKSVMVEVAEGGGLNESLPMLLRVPYFGLPSEFGAYSMLGFGDVILPGLLVAYMRRVDLDLHLAASPSLSSAIFSSKSRGGCNSVPWCSYWFPACVAYGTGLTITYAALYFSWFGDQGQPALLYLVPSTLGTVLVLGFLRGDLRILWDGNTAQYSKVWGDEESGDEVVGNIPQPSSRVGGGAVLSSVPSAL
ncbi:hypothetical protein CEUSTIGMA_g4588.t1 [Chlamydomonas eustigma]|uniref:PA domain-containing protein n=1 Tax=Chlamydomonas eustigma TaxID=1157962 RepID=A0A250X2M2_9CHLO|nr:hypothetical protein CEUSTIGMA_g4588.t1 [Chlamydomonas eustigma]|eukprot:GAX77142.1 hypothetical protein CEUSTIGMA_g4588.t1 [Chlamydomonas eustigma]